jgi:Ca2+-binding RTX toxin-like protein
VDQVTLIGWFTATDKAAEQVEFADGTVWTVADLTTFASIIRGTSGNDALTGTSSAETLYGLAGNDTLNGGTNADTLYGGTGDDTYTVDNVGDAVIENFDEGTDTVKSSLSYALVANVENLTLTGSNAISGTDNSLNNVLVGNSANNNLTGVREMTTLTEVPEATLCWVATAMIRTLSMFRRIASRKTRTKASTMYGHP